MAEGRRLGVADTELAIHWAPDLAKALSQVLNIWAMNFVSNNKDKIARNRLSFREVAGDLRRHQKLLYQSRPGQVSKGAFPTFRSTDLEEDTTPKPTSGPNQKARNPRPKRKRQDLDSESEEAPRHVCEACLCSHKLDICYYANSKLAPKDQKPNQGIKRLVKQRIKEDKSLAKKIKKLSVKKSTKNTLDDS